MDINNLTVGQAKELVEMFTPKDRQKQHGAVGKYCIVRAYASGVHAGVVTHVENNDGRSRCTLANSRRLWQWKAKSSVSLSGVAEGGIVQKESKVTPNLAVIYIEDAIEFIPASDECRKSIEEAGVYNE